MTTTTTDTTVTRDMSTLRDEQHMLTAAIAHAREEALEPEWKDRLLGLRLRLEKRIVAMVERDLQQMDGRG
ncbi:MAG TPA: hypothetical protein VGQ62_16045 [Chloroflexota bacterium]|jgi:hypothetical protein|nr:hypothetical protein [Chloroflexota bacterium]